MIEAFIKEDNERKIHDFFRGDTVIYEMTVENDSGHAVDISDSVIWLSFKKSPKDDDSILQIHYQVPNDLRAQQGRVYLYIPHTYTELLTGGERYWYDLQIMMERDGEMYVKTLFYDNLRVLKEVTMKKEQTNSV